MLKIEIQFLCSEYILPIWNITMAENGTYFYVVWYDQTVQLLVIRVCVQNQFHVVKHLITIGRWSLTMVSMTRTWNGWVWSKFRLWAAWQEEMQWVVMPSAHVLHQLWEFIPSGIFYIVICHFYESTILSLLQQVNLLNLDCNITPPFTNVWMFL